MTGQTILSNYPIGQRFTNRRIWGKFAASQAKKHSNCIMHRANERRRWLCLCQWSHSRSMEQPFGGQQWWLAGWLVAPQDGQPERRPLLRTLFSVWVRPLFCVAEQEADQTRTQCRMQLKKYQPLRWPLLWYSIIQQCLHCNSIISTYFIWWLIPFSLSEEIMLIVKPTLSDILNREI